MRNEDAHNVLRDGTVLKLYKLCKFHDLHDLHDLNNPALRELHDLSLDLGKQLTHIVHVMFRRKFKTTSQKECGYDNEIIPVVMVKF
jgi:hypothetical protein